MKKKIDKGDSIFIALLWLVKAFFGVWPKHQKLLQKIIIESLTTKKCFKNYMSK